MARRRDMSFQQSQPIFRPSQKAKVTGKRCKRLTTARAKTYWHHFTGPLNRSDSGFLWCGMPSASRLHMRIVEYLLIPRHECQFI